MARTHRRRRPSLLHGSPEALAALGRCITSTPEQIRAQQERVAKANEKFLAATRTKREARLAEENDDIQAELRSGRRGEDL